MDASWPLHTNVDKVPAENIIPDNILTDKSNAYLGYYLTDASEEEYEQYKEKYDDEDDDMFFFKNLGTHSVDGLEKMGFQRQT